MLALDGCVLPPVAVALAGFASVQLAKASSLLLLPSVLLAPRELLLWPGLERRQGWWVWGAG
jgi:hypothetical protein